MMAARELWERAMVPSLLSGAGTWVGITTKEEERCDKLQDMFWRIMLEVPESCPRLALKAETRMFGMKHRIWQYQLSLMRKLKKQSLSTLSRLCLEEQKSNDWPGLTKEISDICNKLGLEDLNEKHIPEADIKKAVIEHHDRELLEEVERSKKRRKHKCDNFKDVQDYMKGKVLANCRMSFRIRCEMVQEVKANTKDKYRRRGGEDALLCQDCTWDEVQTQSHCLQCPHWADIRTGLDLTNLEDMVNFFQRMLLKISKDILFSM